MSGKRLLDAARIYGALKSVAQSHVSLRSQQLDTYTKTSSLARAVKSQTDRVTVTAGAAYELAKRLSEDAVPAEIRPRKSVPSQHVPSHAHSNVDHAKAEEFQGVTQDHHYRPSQENGVEDEVARDDFDVHQDRPSIRPLPDGTMPLADSEGSHTALQEGRATLGVRQEADGRPRNGLNVLQGAAERSLSMPSGNTPRRYGFGAKGSATKRQHPTENHSMSLPAQDDHAGEDTFSSRRAPASAQEVLVQEHNPSQDYHPGESASSTIPDPSFAARKAQQLSEMQIPSAGASSDSLMDSVDTFSERTQHSSPSLSALPRTKIPQHAEETEGTESMAQQTINQDVFYTPSPSAKRDSMQGEDIPEGVDLNVFHSPQVASMLHSSGREDRRRAYEMKMNAARRERSSAQSKHQILSGEPKDSKTEEDDTRRLAETLSAEVTQQQTTESLLSESPMSKYEMHESKVPASRLGRIWQFGGLATSMAFGAVGETFRRAVGGSSDGSIMLSEANMNRLVAKLSRMRGAALKLGQMMSFQDSKLLPPAINAVLQRVQDSADYMPPSQRNKVLASSLGPNWNDLFSSFDDVPIAAASIGQVHRATLSSTGQEVAVKVQYPGVRGSIDSDLNNLSLLLTASRLLPKGLYLDKTIANAQTELAWECDYEREAKCGKRFAELIKDDLSVFTVPKVFEEACGPEVLTAEFMSGKGVTKIQDLSQDERDWIGTQILRLCLRELMEWRFMQTDPNWTNFLYNRTEKKLELLDFGASREFPEAFVKPYVELLIAASKKDRLTCRERSIELGYLTGMESKGMLDAHVDSILTLGEPFMEDSVGAYDFRDQTITDRVRAKIGLMVRERLAPPPEETYSLHRKLSGAFLLCARLGSRVNTRDMFVDAVEKWKAKVQ